MGKKKRRAAATPAIKQLEDTKVTFTTHEYEHSNDDADGYGLEAARKLGYDERQVFKTLMADTGDERVIGVVPVNGHPPHRLRQTSVVGCSASFTQCRGEHEMHVLLNRLHRVDLGEAKPLQCVDHTLHQLVRHRRP